MNWLLRNDRKIHLGLAALAAVLVVLSAMGSDLASTLSAAVLFALFFYLVVVGRKLSQATGRGLVEYYRDCDPGPMLENCARLLEGTPDNCRSRYVLSLRANRAGALLALGREEEAQRELDRLSALLSPKKVTQAHVVCGADRVALALRTGRLAGLEGEIETLRARKEKVRVPSLFTGMTFPELMEWCLEGHSCRLLLRTAGPVPVLKDRIQTLLDTAPCRLYQMQAADLMADYFLSLGQPNAARRYLSVVAQQAPELEIGRLAARKVNQLEQV